jgi:hypothetical protein
VIEFAGAEPITERRQFDELPGHLVRLVQLPLGPARTFALTEGKKPIYTLNAGETEDLLRLLGQITVKAPWEAMVGCDGATCTLLLKGPMSEMTFNWWVQVPKGWESVGAVFDYVMKLARRQGRGPAPCG